MQQACRIGCTLARGRLAACVNLIDGTTPIRLRASETQERGEVVLIAKRRPDQMDRLAA